MAKILVIDDSAVQVKALSKILKKYGHTIIGTFNGADGVKLAQQELPDLIMLDIIMPDMNGFQATRKISRDPSTGHIPIILISGKSQETDKQWGMRQGAKGYLVKPLQEAELMNAVEQLLAG